MIRDIEIVQHYATEKWCASCRSPKIGLIEQWGGTRAQALKKLRDHVSVQGEDWPAAWYYESDGDKYNRSHYITTTLDEPSQERIEAATKAEALKLLATVRT